MVELVAAGLPHVIGMRESILDRAGILFAQAFCEAVARKELLPVAMQESRAAITQPLETAEPWRDASRDGGAEFGAVVFADFDEPCAAARFDKLGFYAVNP